MQLDVHEMNTVMAIVSEFIMNETEDKKLKKTK